MIKKLIMTLLLTCTCVVSSSAQAIYNEVRRMQKTFELIKADESLKLDDRKVATFKWDAIEYMLYKAGEDSTFTEQQLGEQTFAMTEFVALFQKRLAEAGNSKSKRLNTLERFKDASISHSLFADNDKQLTLAYYNNADFVTQFSLDTDWVKALADIRTTGR